jgi:hypothetical protein
MSDEHLYARVVDELSQRGPVRALWAKAYAESGGNDQATRALYLRMRVGQLAEEALAVSQDLRRAQPSERRWSKYLWMAGVTLFAIAVVVGLIALDWI